MHRKGRHTYTENTASHKPQEASGKARPVETLTLAVIPHCEGLQPCFAPHPCGTLLQQRWQSNVDCVTCWGRGGVGDGHTQAHSSHLEKAKPGLGDSAQSGHFPTILKALGFIPRTKKQAS